MDAVKATVDAAHWLSAVEDVTVRSAATKRDRTVRLCLDAVAQSLSLQEEDADSLYRITMPARSDQEALRLVCKLAAQKLAPLIELFSKRSERTLTLTIRRNTLSFSRGDQHLLLPHQIEKQDDESAVRFAIDRRSSPASTLVRFVIADQQPLLDSLARCTDTALCVRVEAGAESVIRLYDQTYLADCRASLEQLWPRRALCDRLRQLPEQSKLHVAMSDHQTVSFSSAATQEALTRSGVQREFVIKPYPLTNLYIAAEQTAIRRDDAAPWKSGMAKGIAGKKRNRRQTMLPEQLADDLFEQREDREQRSNDLPLAESAGDLIRSERPELADLPPDRAERIDLGTDDSARLADEARPTELSALEQLAQLPGLQRVKKQVLDIAQFAAFEKERLQALGIASKRPTLHMAFLGNPGTGKTIVARRIGQIFKELGLLSRGHVVEVDRNRLIGAFMGHTEQNLTKYTKRARGGVLFIDEAYALFKKDSAKDFGLTAINGLVKLLEDHRSDLVVIVAGYRQEMSEFFSFNPGLKERIPFHIEFPDYSPDELLAIAEHLAAEDHYLLTEGAKESLLRRALREKLDRSFGNARTVRNLLEKAKIHHAVVARSSSSTLEGDAFTTLTAEDFQAEGDERAESVDDLLDELDSLVGLQEVKRLVKRMTAMLALEQRRSAYGLQDEPLTLHMSFTGNPGTGKTTVARLIGRILRALGLLPKGHFVEAARKDLVAGYLGQTALKTGDKIKEALGGILFLDEAYALARSKRESFGAEALATLIKEMEDKKDILTVILAGYTEEMEELFLLNPGLKSRIRFHLHFPDYSASDLVEIVKRKASQSDYRLTLAAEEKLWQRFIRECSFAGKDFGNGRLAENLLEAAKLNLSTRLARTGGEVDRTMLTTLTEADFEEEMGNFE
ncbi:AAA family ATPase [Tumebacillus lipolyticus]|uniref:AAA family ATPase n=1 Tax=Tumebacillus lipolyticus TaxID=1280370 RepID=A0ABW4ZVH8_9BACL